MLIFVELFDDRHIVLFDWRQSIHKLLANYYSTYREDKLVILFIVSLNQIQYNIGYVYV